MKTLTLFMLLMVLSSGSTHASPPDTIWITVGQPAWQLLQQKRPGLQSVSSRQIKTGEVSDAGPALVRVHLVQVAAADVDELTRIVHGELHHCGGFFAYGSRTEAQASLQVHSRVPDLTRPNYSITHQHVIEPILTQMSAERIGSTITNLSDFQNRYYNGSHGADAADWLAATWTTLAGARNGVQVEKVFRGSDAMPSIVLTIDGEELADQVIVLGAHLDSVNWADRGASTHQDSRAPGADDDASGVAGLTEILRQLMASDYRPQRTIKLMAYSGEEFGLYGSNYIATDYASRNVDVVGVLQLDMTNYQGSESDIYLIDDFTDGPQNQFLESLAQTYLPALSVAHTTCGYGCSDHASWNRQGYAASIPFEAAMSEDNPWIHSSQDTYANTGNQAIHALKFTRLGLAYAVELGGLAGDYIYADSFEP